MKTVPFEELIIHEGRIREEFDEQMIEDLACSIYRNGLFNALTVKDGNDGIELVAGETRAKAISELYECGLGFKHDGEPVPFGEIPYCFMFEHDEHSTYEVELEENILRKDLTWQERVKATARLHKLRTVQHGKYDRSSKEGWSATDTANEIARRSEGRPARKNEVSDVGTAMLLAEYMDDPFVAAAKNEKEALKAIREQKKLDKRNELKIKFDEELASGTANETYKLIHGDFLIEAPKLADESFDVILTDPPYGIDIHKHEFWDGDKHEYDDSEEYFDKLISALASESYRVGKPEAHAYVFCDIRRWERLFVAFELAGWRSWPRPLIWYKGNTGSFGDASHGPRYTYDAILYAIKGEKETTAMYHDVIPITQPTNTEHPASKPVELYIDLLRRSIYPGDSIIDFFCGSGPIFPAAKELNCKAVGIELSDKYYGMSVERISKL